MADKTKLAFDEIKEENIVTEGEERRLCDRCIPGLLKLYRFAFYLCFTCCKYFCVECFSYHDTSHNFLSKGREQREIDRAIDRIGNEGDLVEPRHVPVWDRVYVKHGLDQVNKECFITGLCGADNRGWAACDFRNSCIKIFQCGSNILLRYLRIGSDPYDVTEIQVKQNSTVPDSASSSSSDISGKNDTKPDKQCLLAVTLPWERHILFIDINKNPAVTVKSIPMEKECFSIEYRDAKIFIVCNELSSKEDPSFQDSPWSVYVMSTDGVKLSVIQTGICSYWPGLAVLPGRVYLTDRDNNKVTCINVEGSFLSEITMEGLLPFGISVDPDNNVYVRTGYTENVYKLDMDLTGTPQPLLYPSTGYIGPSPAQCFYRDKLFVGHLHSNIVSVVMLSNPVLPHPLMYSY